MTNRIIDSAGQPLSRRTFAAAGLASAGLIWASGGKAAEKALTAESPMGPFFPLRPDADSDADLTLLKGHAKRASGQVIELVGRVLDVKGDPIANATLDLWQANAAGRYAHPSDLSKAPLDPHFQGFATIRTDAAGHWRLTTIKPGGYNSPFGHRPPHIHFDIRGHKHRTIAQLYFPEEAPANAADALYKALGDKAGTSVAARDSADPNKYAWDVILLG